MQVNTHNKTTKENPFYRMGASLGLLQNVSKLTDKPSRPVVTNYLNEAWKECKDNLVKRQMFFSVVFSFGDITNREHNLLKKKGIKDSQGGAGLRRVFLFCLEWMHNVVPEQFYRFLPIYGEYYNLGAATLFNRLWTDRYKGTITDTHKIAVDVERLTTFIADTLKDKNTSDNELRLWAKWLWTIPGGKRKRKFAVTEKGLNSVKKKYGAEHKVGDVITRVSEKQKETIEKDRFAIKCIDSLSKKMGWQVTEFGKNIQYTGYRGFRSKYMVETEAVMFSTGKIRSLDQVQLLSWFDQLPGGARHRVQRRIVEKNGNVLTVKNKWTTSKGLNIGQVYLDWMKGKEEAQQAMRNLTVADKEKLAKENPDKLKTMQRAAKINVGGESLIDALVAMFSGVSTEGEANLKAHSLMDLMKLLVPVLIAADISGSTSGRPVTYKGVSFTPQGFIKLLTTVFLMKNPDPELAEMFIRFDDRADIIAAGQPSMEGASGNRFMATSMQPVDVLVDKTKDFVWNFNSVAKWILSRGSTHFDVIADELKKWVDAGGGTFRSTRIDMINKYPVFLCLSDGDMNRGTPKETITTFQSKMRQWFGWDGVVVIWDVQQTEDARGKFADLTNVIHYIGFNPGMVTQIFTNLHDLDIIDIYTVLETFYKMDRYQPVRDLVM